MARSEAAPRFGGRGRSWLENMGLIADRGREILNLTRAGRRERSAEVLCRRLLGQRGEASGLALATELVSQIRELDETETARFLHMLASSFELDTGRLEEAIERWRSRRNLDSLLDLTAATEPPREELFRRLNMVPGGTEALVELRARLQRLLPNSPELRAVDVDLRHLLSSWFNRGFLRLEEISWHTPAAILERLIVYESVHQIQGWDDLRRRLAADRRCFAFFHPALPDEPLIFVEVALTQGLAETITPLIDPRRAVAEPARADTAIFYSINNCQPGLKGISFGNFLIKQVLSELSAGLPRLRTFATLSPVPGLREALERRAAPDGFTEARLTALVGDSAEEVRRQTGAEDLVAALERLLATAPPYPPALRPVLRRLALAYLLHVRRGRRVADPVAHFHLSNGARLERVNVDADPSEGGRSSCGVMVNYLYEPDELELNHERYVETGEVALARGLTGEARRVHGAWQQAR